MHHFLSDIPTGEEGSDVNGREKKTPSLCMRDYEGYHSKTAVI